MPSTLPNPDQTPRQSLGKITEAMRANWTWFVVLGALAAVAGLAALALEVTATIVSVLVVGMLMVLTGAAEMVIGLRARTWGGTILWELTGLLYLVAGVLAILDPVPASVIITLFLGAGLVAAGAVRVLTGIRSHDPAVRTPLLVAGGITALLGLVIVLGWPGNSLRVLGMLLGIDLLFSGIGWALFGLRLRPDR